MASAATDCSVAEEERAEGATVVEARVAAMEMVGKAVEVMAEEREVEMEEARAEAAMVEAARAVARAVVVARRRLGRRAARR